MLIRFTDKDLEGGNFLPEGEHEVTITEIKGGQSKAGADMLTFTFKDRLGREGKEYVLTDENSRWKLARIAVAAGLSKDDLRASGLNVPSLMGAKMLLVKTQTGVEMWEGKERKRYSNDYYPPRNTAPTTGGGVNSHDNIPF